MQEPLTLYKLMILYLLSLSKNPLKKIDINDCILEKKYTDYLTLQTAIGELEENGFLSSAQDGNVTWLSTTDEGNKALSLFLGNLNEEIRADLRSYLEDHKMELNNSYNITSRYQRSANGEWEATVVAKDRGNTLVEIKLCVPSEEIAADICKNWTEKCPEVYNYLIEKLF